MRHPLITPLASRDGSVDKDEKLVNCYGEQDDETKETFVFKRAGMALGTAVITGPDAYPGQGLFNYGGYWFSMINDVFYYNSIWESIGAMVIWDSGDTYNAADEVLHEGVVYLATDTSTNVEPGTDETKWIVKPASGSYPADLMIEIKDTGAPYTNTTETIIKDSKIVLTGGVAGDEFWETTDGVTFTQNMSYTHFPTLTELYDSGTPRWWYFDDRGSSEWLYSTDLTSWTNVVGSSMPIGGNLQFIVFDSKVWAIGRRGGVSANKNDLCVSYTTDFITWTQYYKAGIQHASPVCILYNSRLYILGGGWIQDADTGPNIDIWVTTVGGKGATATDWEEVTSDWGMSSGLTAYGYGPVVWDGKVWILSAYAGSNGFLSAQEVAYTSDLVTWTPLLPSTHIYPESEGWPQFVRFTSKTQVRVFDSKIYVFGGVQIYDDTDNVFRTSITG